MEGRADGILTTGEGVLVDEIKTTALPLEEIDGENRVLGGGALHTRIWSPGSVPCPAWRFN